MFICTLFHDVITITPFVNDMDKIKYCRQCHKAEKSTSLGWDSGFWTDITEQELKELLGSRLSKVSMDEII